MVIKDMTIKEYVKIRKEELKELVSNLPHQPNLVIVQLNEDEASNAYVRGKIKDASELGINPSLIKLDVNTSEEKLLELIAKLNEDSNVDGFIVQMPLPKHIDAKKVELAINPKKDIDGFHPMSNFTPCTPLGILNYLKRENISLVGKNAVVIGRSDIVGRPMAKLLLNESCNVSVLHSKTSRSDMEKYVANADIIVVAVGKQALLDNTFKYKKSAVIIDVGINRDESGLHGDALPGLDVYLQTPVPGGVGLLTRLSLMENLIKAVK